MTRRRVLVAAVAFGIAFGIAVAVTIVVYPASSSRCDNVSFHQVEAQRPAIPPVGGHELIVDRARRAFKLAHTNVVYCDDFADPTVLRVGADYFAYSTNTGDRHLPVLYGAGIFDARHVADALPTLPVWAAPGWVWAPSVIATGHGYLLYYVTAERATGNLCISNAFSTKPIGPFVDGSRRPMLCNAIDPKPFIDPRGNAYLFYAQTGNIFAVHLAPDLHTLIGPPTRLIAADQPWESGIVEAPTMRRVGATYFLFFSGNRFDTAAYAIGYARCASPVGPCRQASGPWLSTQGNVRGPGGQDIFTDTQNQTWMVFHAWIGTVGYPHGARYLFVIPLTITGNVPSAAPSSTPRP